MGASASAGKDAAEQEAETVLSKEVADRIRSMDGEHGCTLQSFNAVSSGPLGARIFKALKSDARGGSVVARDLLLCAAACAGGDDGVVSDLAFRFLGPSPTFSELCSLVDECSAQHSHSSLSGAASERYCEASASVARAIFDVGRGSRVQAAPAAEKLSRGECSPQECVVSPEAFGEWCGASGRALTGSVRSHGTLGATIGVRLPRVPDVDSRGVDAQVLLLQSPWLWALAPHLPLTCTKRWSLLFSSAKHGASFRTLSARCVGRPGVVMVVRDKAGGVAMGFCDVAWQKGTTFVGGYTSFLASLSPTFRVHKPKGANQNFCWFAEAFQSVPNGIGWGGQVGHFGLFLEESLDKGHSRMSATYDNPPLLGDPSDGNRFQIESVEVWAADHDALVEFEEEAARIARRAAANEGSALDQFATDRNFLFVSTGKGAASDGYRDPGPLE